MNWLFKKAFSILIMSLFLLAVGLSSGYLLAEDAPIENNATSTEMAIDTDDTELVSLEDITVGGQDLVTLNFRNADILEVIGVFAEKTGMNMVVGPDVKATVNIELNNMPWEKALEVILRNYNLTYKKENSLIRIMTLEQMRLEEEKVPLVTKILPLNFANAEDIQTSFSSMLSPRGKIEINTRTNSLIITDLPDKVNTIESIANSLDTRTPQVMIEAMMADVKLTNEDQLGIQWKIARHETATAPYGKSAKALYDQTLGLAGSVAGTITFGQTILKYTDLSYTLQVWKEQKRVNILAHPIIMTMDNQPAHIELIEQIPYTQQSTSTDASTVVASTSFKDAGIKLDVTPHITTKGNYISMNLKVEQSFRSGFTPDNQPIIDSRKAETNLLVKDMETIVIGGLRKKEDTVTIDKVPFLGDIPILGTFFKRTSKAVTDVDLLIFVTPKIVVEPTMTTLQEERLEMFARPPEEDIETISRTKKTVGKEEEIFYLRPPSEK